VLAAVLPLAGAMSYLWWQALEEVRTRELALLQARVDQVERDLIALRDQSEWVMSRMARRPAFRALSPAACDDEMAVMREVNPAFLAITLWDRDGALVCSSYPLKPDQPRPKPHRKSFDVGIATDGLYLSNMFPGQITGLDLVTFTYPVKDGAGAVAGLLSIPVRSDHFAKLMESAVRGPGSVAGIADRNLVLVARVPVGGRMVGKSIAGVVADAAPAQSPTGALLSGGTDGVQRLVLRKVVPTLGWRVFVGVEEEVLFAGFRRQLEQGAAVLAIVAALSLGFAYLIARGISQPLRQLVYVADSVAKGERATRATVAGTSEIAMLAEHLNRMLDAIEQFDASLHESNRRLRELSGRLLGAQEDERMRISRGLHDQIGQELTAIKIRLDTLAQQVQDPALRARVLEIANASGETLQRVRQISVDLRPPQLDSLGLAAALRAHVERQAALGRTAMHFEAGELPRLSGDNDIRCFRIAQEALNNVLRHSKAANAWVRLAVEGGNLVLTVRDDGVGFDMGAMRRPGSGPGGIGVLGMQERMGLAGGLLDIRSQPGQGCIVTATFPVTEAVAA
jgi:signal transduction histidine kinase